MSQMAIAGLTFPNEESLKDFIEIVMQQKQKIEATFRCNVFFDAELRKKDDTGYIVTMLTTNEPTLLLSSGIEFGRLLQKQETESLSKIDPDGKATDE